MKETLATVDDIPQLRDKFIDPLVRKICERQDIPYDEDSTNVFMSNLAADLGNGKGVKPLLMKNKDDEIIGALFLYRDKPFYTTQAFLSDHGLYVAEDYRRQGVGKKLTQWAILTARQNGLVYIPSSKVTDPKVDRMYRELGGEYYGGVWLFRR